MDTLWSCVITIIILCFIGVLIWLLLRKSISPNKKFKGGGIKMKGGMTLEEAAGALVGMVDPNNLDQDYPPEFLEAALIILITFPPDVQLDEVASRARYLANIVFSRWRICVEHGFGMLENGPDVILNDYISRALATGNVVVIRSALDSCMKSPFAYEWSLLYDTDSPVEQHFRDLINTDYLARLFYIFHQMGGEFGANVIISDLNSDEANAILTAIKHDGVVEYLCRILTSIQLEEPQFLKNKAYCLLSLAQKLATHGSPATGDILTAAAGTYNAYYKSVEPSPLVIWQSLEKISEFINNDYDPFSVAVSQLAQNILGSPATAAQSAAAIINETSDPGIVDFDYITRSINNLDYTLAIFDMQSTMLNGALSAATTNKTPQNLYNIYALASNLVELPIPEPP